ncbi:MAG: ABC transporter substrate-binding protein, partial [Patescibacteria group bacterium]
MPNLGQLKYLGRFLSSRESWLIRASSSIIVLSLLFVATRFYFVHLQVVPVSGGEYFEVLVGSPKYINPLYAGINDVDDDISRLVFSSLMKYDKDGQIITDLADSYEVSEDGKAYDFKIRKNVKWHNGSNLTVDDIIFTFNAIKDPQYKSPLRGSFGGVEIERIDDETVKFTLAESYAPFLDMMTFGVMPQDLWYQVSPQGAGLAELNLKPIGSGPYKFKSLTKDKLGQIKSYSLTANNNYYKEVPYISGLTFKFFGNFEEAISAFNDGMVDGVSYMPKQLKGSLNAKNSINFYKLNLPQLTAVFFNKKKNTNLADVKVRRALAFAINKSKIVEDVLGGDAEDVSGPILTDSFAYNFQIRKYDYNKDEAGKLLDEAGWQAVEITEQELSDIEKKRSENEEGKISESEEEKTALCAGKWRANKDNKFLTI